MTLHQIERTIAERRRGHDPGTSLLVAISGIDGSGKTFLSGKLAEGLTARGLSTALIEIDAWHTPPDVRFGSDDPGRHFYMHAFRFDELFGLVIDPLRRTRSLLTTVELTRLPENDLFAHTYDFRDVDVILFQGIFVLRRDLRPRYDLAFWIECSFETALKRALLRNQEGLSVAEIIRDYETIYFPAQRVHLAEDNPIASADGVLVNDGM